MRLEAWMALLLVAFTPAAADASGQFVPYTPLTLEELYSKRMRFNRGEPRISVGLMDGQESISFAKDQPLRLMFDEQDLPKVVYGTKGYTFKVIKSTPARVRHWVVVHTQSGLQGYPKKVLSQWKRRGYTARVFEAGTAVAVRGNVLDTRQWNVGVGGFSSRKKALALLDELSKANPETFLEEELLALPDGVIGVYDRAGKLLHKAGPIVFAGTVADGKVEVLSVEFGRGYKSHGRQTRTYRGAMYVAVDRKGRLALVNSVRAEALLNGLVPAEIFASAPLEALKAQAVTARGEIFTKMAHRHFADPFHICSEQHCQVYSGVRAEHPNTNRAVALTRGLISARPRPDKKGPLVLVDSRYSSSCGGHSEGNEIVWGTAPSASLRPRLDAASSDPALAAFAAGLTERNVRAFVESYPPTACAKSSFAKSRHFRWTRTFSAADAHQLVEPLGIGVLKDVKILGRGKGGRVTGLLLVGSLNKKKVHRELPVRRLFDNLKSGLFVLDIERDPRGNLASLTFTGGGWGHGVGMCQTGAIGRAEKGQSFEDILAHYYSGATVERVY